MVERVRGGRQVACGWCRVTRHPNPSPPSTSSSASPLKGPEVSHQSVGPQRLTVVLGAPGVQASLLESIYDCWNTYVGVLMTPAASDGPHDTRPKRPYPQLGAEDAILQLESLLKKNTSGSKADSSMLRKAASKFMVYPNSQVS